MKVIGIGGLPASGKTFLCKKMGQKLDRLAIEFEALRWKYFIANLEKMKAYTNQPMKEDESFRDYFLRCCLKDSKISMDDFVEWQKDTMLFINEEIKDIISFLKKLPNNYPTEKIADKLGNLIIYMPKHFNNDLIVCSHSLLSTTEESQYFDELIEMDSSYDEIVNNFYKREKFSIEEIPVNKVEFFLEGFKRTIANTMGKAYKFKNTYNNDDTELDNFLKKIKNY